MGRNPLPPEQKKKLFNCYLDPNIDTRMKIICFRRSIYRKKKFSEGSFISGQIVKTRLPKMPTQDQIDEYLRLYPKERKRVAELMALTPPKK